MSSAAQVLHQPSDVTQDWIERALGRRVVSFARSESRDSNWGSHVQLKVSVEGERLPLALHLKIASAATFGRAEVDYYTRTFASLADAPMVRCHHADADATHYNLLLNDHSGTHRDQKVVEPTLGYGRALVEAAAKLHAHCWPQVPPEASVVERSLAEATAGQDAMLEAMKQGFTDADRATARRLIELNPAAREARMADAGGFTWIHGDINPTNVLAPIEGDGPIYLLDHQPFAEAGAMNWLGIRDLAYAIVVWWPVELRRRWERELVGHWHAMLVSRGVGGYSMERAWDDWRLCGMAEISVPAGWCAEAESAGGMRGLWEAQLRRVLAFADDHG